MTDNEQRQIFAQNLNNYIYISGKTQKEIADKIGVSPQTFNTWCQGIAIPRMGKVQALADYFNISKSDLIDKKIETQKIEPEIMTHYNRLNETGKQEATKRVEELTHFDKYIDPTAPEPPLPLRYINYYYRLASAGTGEIIFDTPPTKSIAIPASYDNVDYAIGVNGDSMAPKFKDGDILLVEMTQSVNVGEIGIFQIDGNCYVKKLGKSELISLNKDHKNIPLNEEATCMGRVIDKL